ncbi:hypothetical protein ACET3Z_026205 [Daucus carota]
MNVEVLDWLERFPNLQNQVKYQTGDICWAIAGSFVVSAVPTIRFGVRRIAATQDLIDNCYPNYPEGAARGLDGNVLFDRFGCCGMFPEFILKYVKKFGIMYERDYEFTGVRNLHPPIRPPNVPRLYLYYYRILRSFTDEYMPLTEEVAYSGPMMGTVFFTPEFQSYRGGIIEMEGQVGLDEPHSIFIVGMDQAEGESVGWIRYELIFDILRAGYVYEDIPSQRRGPRGSGGPGGSGSGSRGSGSGPRGSGSGPCGSGSGSGRGGGGQMLGGFNVREYFYWDLMTSEMKLNLLTSEMKLNLLRINDAVKDATSTESASVANENGVLSEAESENAKQMKLEDFIMGNMGSDVSVVVPGKENKRMIKKFLHQKDSWILGEIHRLKEQSSDEFKKTEEKLLQSVAEMQNLEVQLEAASAHDYRLILVPPLKSFTPVCNYLCYEHLEELAQKYAMDKSDAVREAFLAEVALDFKKHIVNGNDGARHDKSKEKKNNKDSRKAKDVKTIANNELHVHPQEIAEFNSLSLECYKGHEPAIGGSGVDLGYNEEESEDRKLEVEAEVRKLEETLEYQRMIENQAQGRVPLRQSNHNDQIITPSLSNGVGEGGSAGFNRRTGRRSKCEKYSNKFVEGKFQALPFGQLESNDRLHDDAYMVNGTKTPRQLLAEEDDEEGFQADLKRAVCQSLGMEDVGLTPNEVSVEYVNGVDVCGTGLKNEAGDLNVIIQSLWHIRCFTEGFLRRSALGHVHISDPCVICALYDIFNALNRASSDLRSEAVAPTSLRTALSNLYPESNFFQEAQMNDASEVLAFIFEFDCIHCSFTSGFGVSDTKSIESNGMGSWGCANDACVAHSLFGTNVLERLNCYSIIVDWSQLAWRTSVCILLHLLRFLLELPNCFLQLSHSFFKNCHFA